MTTNTGTLSFILYGIFIVMAIAGMFIAIYFIRSSIPAEKLEKIIDLAKYSIVSVAIATITLIITDLFKEREQDVKELEYFDKYVQDMKKVENIQERLQLSKYLSIVSPAGELKNSWKKLHDTLRKEYVEYLAALEQQKKYAALDSLTKEQNDSLVIATDKIEINQSPIVGSASNIKPRVYIQIGKEEQRAMARELQAVLQQENFITPGIDYGGSRNNIYIPAKTEVRYYREEDRLDAVRLIEILKSKNAMPPVKDIPVRIPGNGRGTRPGHFEIWFSK
jgi:hypothetical protein